MSETAKHTPTPWVVRETVIGGKWIEPEDAEYLVPLSGSGGARSYTSRIVEIQDHDHNDANAEFIVKAVNCHAEMLEALKGAIGALEFSRDYHSDLGNEEQAFAQDRLDAALRAIAKATGARP